MIGRCCGSQRRETQIDHGVCVGVGVAVMVLVGVQVGGSVGIEVLASMVMV